MGVAGEGAVYWEWLEKELCTGSGWRRSCVLGVAG